MFDGYAAVDTQLDEGSGWVRAGKYSNILLPDLKLGDLDIEDAETQPGSGRSVSTDFTDSTDDDEESFFNTRTVLDEDKACSDPKVHAEFPFRYPCPHFAALRPPVEPLRLPVFDRCRRTCPLSSIAEEELPGPWWACFLPLRRCI
jgi:hypothetical protein